MPKRKKEAECYLCGGNGPATKDHIFPKCLFPQPRPSDLPTAPACPECHSNTLSKDEELFRVLAASGMAYEHSQGSRVWDQGVRPDLQGKRPGLKSLLRRLVREREVFSPGGIYLGSELCLEFDPERINNVLSKIAKGLYYLDTGQSLPEDVVILAKYGDLNPEQLTAGDLGEAIRGANRIELGDQVVVRWRNTVKDDPRQSLTWLVFYGTNAFLICTYPKGLLEEAHVTDEAAVSP